MSKLLGLDDVYPKAVTVLLWLATAIAVTVTVSFAMVKIIIANHDHPTHAHKSEIHRIAEGHKEIEARMDKMLLHLAQHTESIVRIQTVLEWKYRKEMDRKP